VGDAPSLKEVREVIARVGPTTARVLITGENGTGKELVARAIHEASPRRAGAFIEVNCAAIPSELIESELFGHVKGSFTGAVTDRSGKFEQADQGTLFLDEVGDMSLEAQAKVLRALEEGVITRVGGAKSVQVDVRVIAATNKNVEEEISRGRFREDLFYRLNVVPIRLPPLRERRGDIRELVQHFVRQLAGGAKTAGKSFDSGAIERLEQRQWPGNVRELRNAVERLLILSTAQTITANDVGRILGGEVAAPVNGPGGTFESFMQEAEKSFLTAKLAEFNWNISETARAIKMPRSALYKRIERHGLGDNAR
jgi:two-component system nitrogen regulation response regulator NtrX